MRFSMSVVAVRALVVSRFQSSYDQVAGLFANFRSTTLAPVMVLCVSVLLSACNAGKPLPPCPQVRVDSTTAQLTKFREGSGRDLNDVEYQARMLGFKRQCEFKDNGVDVTMDLVIEVASGPAAKAGHTPLYYFVALPQFFPDPTGKRVIATSFDLEPGVGRRQRINENGVHVFIPLAKDEPAAAYDVYVGLQLDQDQLEYNRNLEKAR
jgi:hypothetical protein